MAPKLGEYKTEAEWWWGENSQEICITFTHCMLDAKAYSKHLLQNVSGPHIYRHSALCDIVVSAVEYVDLFSGGVGMCIDLEPGWFCLAHNHRLYIISLL